jgi:hypothetical protein
MAKGRSRATALAVALGLASLSLGACSAADDDGSPPAAAAVGDGIAEATTTVVAAPIEAEEVAAGEDFYAVPDPLPAGDHGRLLRYQRVEHDVEGVDAYRIMYLSEALAGEPIAVTGTVLAPQAPAPDGGWPVIAHSHGTTGLADECAPSRNYPDGVNELALLRSVATDYVVAATDYEGLGTPGLHPYLVGESEGRSTMDAARAAGQLPGVTVSPTTFIAGYSQGGHGALWANQVAGSWTPELDVRGTFAGAPPGEIQVIGTVAATGGLAGGFFMLIAAGHAAAHPELDLDDLLTPAGLEAIGIVDEVCAGAALAELSRSGQVDVDPGTVPAWQEALEASSPGSILGAGPVLIVHSLTDEVVPAGLSAAIVNRQCRIGQVVERRTLPDGSHTTAAVPAYRQAFEWFEGLLAGEEPVSSCPGA